MISKRRAKDSGKPVFSSDVLGRYALTVQIQGEGGVTGLRLVVDPLSGKEWVQVRKGKGAYRVVGKVGLNLRTRVDGLKAVWLAIQGLVRVRVERGWF